MLSDIQLVDLPTPENFKGKKESYPTNMPGFIYRTSWISKTWNAVVVYVGSHKIRKNETNYLGSGLLVKKAILKYGIANISFQILQVLTEEDMINRWQIENEYIIAHINKYGKLCRNLRLNGNGGGSIWTPEMREKFKQTSQKHFGTDHPFQAESIKQKIRQHHQENLGVDYPMQSSKTKEKLKQTCLKKYGVENISQAEDIKQKKKQTCTNHFGGQGLASPVLRQKMLQRYGDNIINVSQVLEIQERKKENKIRRYSNAERQPKQARKVEQINLLTGEILNTFLSGAAAAFFLYPNNIQSARVQICRTCKGKQAQYGGYGWRYSMSNLNN